ncbi:hypothetical protein B0H19DRAFT_1277282 [Mycena capillaripes]|nr:hypothetical protein B0H19DRAFT_1277282 [Mycena capillaripes]
MSHPVALGGSTAFSLLTLRDALVREAGMPGWRGRGVRGAECAYIRVFGGRGGGCGEIQLESSLRAAAPLYSNLSLLSSLLLFPDNPDVSRVWLFFSLYPLDIATTFCRILFAPSPPIHASCFPYAFLRVVNLHLFPSSSSSSHSPFAPHPSSSHPSSFSSAYPYSPLTSPTQQREQEHAMQHTMAPTDAIGFGHTRNALDARRRSHGELCVLFSSSSLLNAGGEEDENVLEHGRDEGGLRGAADKARTTRARAEYVALIAWSASRCIEGTLVNACVYILRDALLTFLVGEAEAGLETGVACELHTNRHPDDRSPLHCLRSVHEALDFDSSPTSITSNGEGQDAGLQAQGRLFGSGFTTRPPDALLAPLQYELGALADADTRICLQAALALRSLCDANRHALASRIGAFAEVHAGLGRACRCDSQKGKVLQSIASVIQALPSAEGITPVEAMVGPILQRRAARRRRRWGAHPEAVRLAAILQLEILADVVKGLTRTVDPLVFDEEEGGGEEAGGGGSGRAVERGCGGGAGAQRTLQGDHGTPCALIRRAVLYAPISPEMLQQLQAHMIRKHGCAIMRAVLCGFAGAAPRSVAPNLLELLTVLVSRWDEHAVAEAEGEMREGRQLGRQDAKERFVKTVVGSRSVKKTKEAANQFTIFAWGLEGWTFEGWTFGYLNMSSV